MSEVKVDKAALAIQAKKEKPSLARVARKPKAKSKPKCAGAPDQIAQAPSQTLTQVAVTAADSELENAKRVYQARKQENVVELFDFIREEQSATAIAVEDAVLDFHGLTRDDLYELSQPAGD